MITITYDPATHVLVPLDPTDDMCRNARERIGTGSNVAHHVYKAMLAAAPVAPVGQQGGQSHPFHRDMAGLIEFIDGMCAGDPKSMALVQSAWYLCMERNHPANLAASAGQDNVLREQAATMLIQRKKIQTLEKELAAAKASPQLTTDLIETAAEALEFYANGKTDNGSVAQVALWAMASVRTAPPQQHGFGEVFANLSAQERPLEHESARISHKDREALYATAATPAPAVDALPILRKIAKDMRIGGRATSSAT